jgi:hypothetical protein
MPEDDQGCEEPEVFCLRKTRLDAGPMLLATMLVIAFAGPASADPVFDHQASISGDLSELSSPELKDRIRFLASRFREGERYARLWQNGFTGAWGAIVAKARFGFCADDNRRVYSGPVLARRSIRGWFRARASQCVRLSDGSRSWTLPKWTPAKRTVITSICPSSGHSVCYSISHVSVFSTG